jgi:hypothetical protein
MELSLDFFRSILGLCWLGWALAWVLETFEVLFILKLPFDSGVFLFYFYVEFLGMI